MNPKDPMHTVNSVLLPEEEPPRAMRNPQPDELMLTQYLRPNGEARKVLVSIGEEHVKRAEGMVLSAEVLTTGDVVIYAKWNGEDEDSHILICHNGPVDQSMSEEQYPQSVVLNIDPAEAVRRIIDLNWRRTHG